MCSAIKFWPGRHLLANKATGAASGYSWRQFGGEVLIGGPAGMRFEVRTDKGKGLILGNLEGTKPFTPRK
jgi:hypothetical protein